MYHMEVETAEAAPENMDDGGMYASNRNTIKTDLCLLLECVKFQMNCPDLQKQALVTIGSICKKKEHSVELLREMGGVIFVYNLFKSSVVHPSVRQTALYTLCILAETSVSCKNSLCRKEMFLELGSYLLEEDASLKQKSVSVYLLSVLVTDNKAGQTLARTTGCIHVLLNLFRNMFPEPTADSAHICLWTSVANALCGCVNNPQNEEIQRICMSSFPNIKMWLQQVSLPCFEVFRYLCFFITMTVANNACVQESFAATGSLEIFVLLLIRLASESDTSLSSGPFLLMIIKTTTACIANSASLALVLARYTLAGHLVSVLASPHLSCDDRLAALILLGHCTGASEEHQRQLVQSGGLPLLITLLAEETDEEVRKFAMFILQTCKQAKISGQKQEEDEKPDTQAAEDFAVSSPPPSSLLQQGCRPSPDNSRTRSVFKLLDSSNVFDMKEKEEACENAEKENPESSSRSASCSVCRGTGSLMQSQVQPLEGGRDAHTVDSSQLKSPERGHHVRRAVKCSDGEELQESDMFGVKRRGEEQSHYNERCAGCVIPFEKVTSRTFGSVLFSCRQKCDMHKVLLEATELFMAPRRRALSEGEKGAAGPSRPKPEGESAGAPRGTPANWNVPSSDLKNFNMTPFSHAAKPGRIAKRRNEINLTPTQRGAKAPKFS
ncbi:telomere repeats-binding bouquet formation protein 1 isoform X2 [Syngnathoides biaculeatus]|uniref:telomere repeats-binding bouquet formation protein 1 isoform X2 n=1 Tax=Syngnathoides biaculeatus TaxID=300417 RepID=UPI002ADE08F4|nr:telomere repeats-binding bouquet formation protein 1 isoform X2 [Syngnathoides biaculeatus]